MRINLFASVKFFWAMVIIYAFCAAISIYLPQGGYTAGMPAALPAPKPIMSLAIFGLILVAYGGLGIMGLKLARKIGVPVLFDKTVSNKWRFFYPAIAGAICGVILIIGDNIFASFNGIGHFPHPAFPASILAAISAAIGEEIIFRLFYISFLTWLVSKIILRGRYLNQTFWIMSLLSAIIFGLAHYPSIMYLYGFNSLSAIPPGLQMEIISLNALIGIVAAAFFKKSGYLAAVGVHFWTDIVWHVIYGF
jgi:membrane protease YdiL (CAAX protease family)